ncbi:MAG: hypothetical protein U0793_13680 [Gemmataceae bacterium]
MARWLGAALVLIASGVFLLPNGSAGPKKSSELAKIMADKLKNSQILLEGLALGDFDKITRSAEKLIQLSKTAEWMVFKTPRYEVHTNEFRRAAEVILQKAQAKNLDGVAYGYVDLTMTCVRCHAYVREARDTSTAPPIARR